jgi:MFS family permease
MTTTSNPTTVSYAEIKDSKGRLYRVGETDKDLLGHPRRLMVILPWIAMMGISVFEYAYGSAEDTLSKAHGWTHTNTFWILSVWIFFQAAVAFPAGRLREKGVVSARAAMLTGAALSLAGFLAISHANSVLWAIAGFGILGGIGAGLVYATCINMVGKWYPERRGGKTGFVNGGFAYGALPFIFIFNYAFDTGNYHQVLDLVGLYVLASVAICGLFFKDPPKNWWPAHVDPLTWSQQGRGHAAMAKNPPAVHQYGPREAIRTGMLPLMWFCLAFISGVSIFGISFQVPYAKEMGFGPLVAASSMGIMSIINGTGRGIVGWLSDRVGRRQVLMAVLVIEGGRYGERAAVLVLRTRVRLWRRRLLSDVRGPGARLLRGEQQRDQLRAGLQREARQRPVRRWARRRRRGCLGLLGRIRAGRRHRTSRGGDDAHAAPAGTSEDPEDHPQPLSDQQGDHVTSSAHPSFSAARR